MVSPYPWSSYRTEFRGRGLFDYSRSGRQTHAFLMFYCPVHWSVQDVVCSTRRHKIIRFFDKRKYFTSFRRQLRNYVHGFSISSSVFNQQPLTRTPVSACRGAMLHRNSLWAWAISPVTLPQTWVHRSCQAVPIHQLAERTIIRLHIWLKSRLPHLMFLVPLYHKLNPLLVPQQAVNRNARRLSWPAQLLVLCLPVIRPVRLTYPNCRARLYGFSRKEKFPMSWIIISPKWAKLTQSLILQLPFVAFFLVFRPTMSLDRDTKTVRFEITNVQCQFGWSWFR